MVDEVPKIGVMGEDGQRTLVPTTDATVAQIQGLSMLTTLPAQFDHLIRVPAANGMVKASAVSHTAVLADAITAVNTARQGIVDDFTTQLSGKMPAPTGTTSQYIRGDGSLTTFPAIPTLPVRAYTNPVRPLNTAFQISTTRDCMVSYSTDIACSGILLAGQSGSVILEYADNSAITTNVINCGQSTQSAGGVLNVSTIGTANNVGIIPSGKYVRIRTVNNTGAPTFTFKSSQETLL